MTAAVYRSTPALSVPQTQNTAPVFEFNCLYTHDVKKKQKKWQDGFLRYHTFNKRAMVYDVPRNLIGDCHWTGNEPVQEGDELRLERNGVMVEVGDSIGQTETDLSELRKSKKKDSAANATIAAPSRPTPRPVNGTAPARGNGQQKHRSLGALLGTPRNPLGKAAFPQRSSFEDRHGSTGTENEGWEDGRPPKRQRMGTAEEWSVTRNAKAGKPTKQLETPLWARKADAVKKQKKSVSEPGQHRLATKEVITLSDDENQVEDSRDTLLPGFSDDALAPSSPVRDKRKDACKETARSSSPAFQARRAPPAVRPPKEDTRQKSEARKRAQAPSKSRPPSPIRQNVPAMEQSKERHKLVDQAPERPTRGPEGSRLTGSKSGQTLRLAAGAPKKTMLLCQAQAAKKPQRPTSTNKDSRTTTSTDVTGGEQEDRPMSAREKLEARLARIDAKGRSTSSARFQPVKTKPPPVEVKSDHDLAGDGMVNNDSDGEDDAGEQQGRSTHERSAIELQRQDEMMLPPAAPRAPAQPLPPPNPPSPPALEARPLRRVASDTITAQPSRPKRIPGAQVRYTPTPSPTKSRQTTPIPVSANEKATTAQQSNRPAAPVKTFSKKKPFQKSVSLNVTSNGTSTVILSKPFQAPGKAAAAAAKKAKEPELPRDVGPWSREAFDLFTWRPPNWDEEKWCVNESNAKGPTPPAGLSGGTSLPHVL